MNLLEAMAARHSVRSYTDKSIEGETLSALEHEIEECDVVVAFGIKDLEDKMDVQVRALGYGLTIRDFVTSVAGGAAQVVLDTGDSPEEKKAALCLLADEINRLTREVKN